MAGPKQSGTSNGTSGGKNTPPASQTEPFLSGGPVGSGTLKVAGPMVGAGRTSL